MSIKVFETEKITITLSISQAKRLRRVLAEYKKEELGIENERRRKTAVDLHDALVAHPMVR